MMKRRVLLAGVAAGAFAVPFAGMLTSAAAQEVVKIGLIATLTGPQASSGRQKVAGARLFMAQNGDMVAGKKIELIVKDDTGVADQTRRIAQELIVNDKVAFLAGFSLTPLALAVAPVITQAKVPAIIMTAGTSVITERSPYFVRVSFTLPQQTVPITEWAAKNGIKTAVSLVSDYGPGIDAQDAFKMGLEARGGKVLEQLKAPLANPEFAAFLQRAKDLKPDALFLFVPAPTAGSLMRQVVDRGISEAGIKVIGTGDITDDDQLNGMGDAVIGLTTSHFYSAAHDSPMNKKFVADFKAANNNMRPNFIGVAGYDGMHLMYEALKKTDGKTDGTALVEAMKGMKVESPRGSFSIDPATRDVVQDVYIRKVERKDGELYNVEFDVVKDVKDPTHK
ncbi:MULTISPECIES: ABC transporter substrate-binding protein [unclassified Beijerinckia]|uniref:ABC transporter substrate-binding protein n=1 Tax=unclassified Beijerinckia TaxID=2638183 RepID=UPI00089C05AE|nr:MULTISPECIES: ABC transporter substrate-binding protein [unclassified Beijerinckia]MDH7796507.1 branched-chain amino acid transport system substrate-binding protein [Beijerinckia sp. GAS462]SEC48067.1 amino acid/amide ABC transporter substrate-binding protein, HAAT family [Beijerinckia sp. 28-YEA-48]